MNKMKIAIFMAAAVLVFVAVLAIYLTRYREAGHQDAVQNIVKQDLYEQNPASASKAIAKNPNDVNGDGTNIKASQYLGAFIAPKPGDAVKFTEKQTDPIWVMCTEQGGCYAFGIE